MARISKSDPGERSSIEAKVGVRMARLIRKRVGAQVEELIVDTELTGSPDYIRRRLKELVMAEKDGDDLVRRAAAMELAAAAAAYAVEIELRSPSYAKLRTSLGRK